MEAKDRREIILDLLNKTINPIKGTELSEKLKVSRQIIVQDIALLRAKGENIIATPQGYMLPKRQQQTSILKTIACNHRGNDAMEDELLTIVDLGGKIIDVIVEHPIYGEIKSQLQIGSRYDLKLFIDNLKTTKAEPLSSLTGGVHLHTIEVENEKMYEMIIQKLLEKNHLIKEE